MNKEAIKLRFQQHMARWVMLDDDPRDMQTVVMDALDFALEEEELPAATEQWKLFKLEPNGAGEQRWSAGVHGPRVYLTCDETTAKIIITAVNAYSPLLRALGVMVLTGHIHQYLELYDPKALEQASSAINSATKETVCEE